MRQLRQLRTLRPSKAPKSLNPWDFEPRHDKRPPPKVRRLKDFPPPTVLDTPCRLWQGAVDQYGYGAMKRYLPDGTRKSYKVHRWVVEQALDRPLKPTEVVLHLCDHPPCYRYDHLRVGTVQDNNADMLAKGRARKPPVNRLYGAANPNSKERKATLGASAPSVVHGD